MPAGPALPSGYTILNDLGGPKSQGVSSGGAPNRQGMQPPKQGAFSAMPNRSLPQNMMSIEDNSANAKSAGYGFNSGGAGQYQDGDNYLSNEQSNEYSVKVHNSRIPNYVD